MSSEQLTQHTCSTYLVCYQLDVLRRSMNEIHPCQEQSINLQCESEEIKSKESNQIKDSTLLMVY